MPLYGNMPLHGNMALHGNVALHGNMAKRLRSEIIIRATRSDSRPKTLEILLKVESLSTKSCRSCSQ